MWYKYAFGRDPEAHARLTELFGERMFLDEQEAALAEAVLIRGLTVEQFIASQQ